MMDYNILIPSQVFIKEVKPVIVRDEKLYAQEIKLGITENIFLDAEELSGLSIANYEGKNAESVLEIIEAKFLPKPPENKEETDIDSEALALEYLGYLPACYFFPPPGEDVKRDGKLNVQLYERDLEKQFSNYSKDGFPLEPFETYPTMQMDNGTVLLFNKIIFDKKLKTLKRSNKVWVKLLEARFLSVTSARKLPTKEELEERKKESAKRFKSQKSRWNIFS